MSNIDVSIKLSGLLPFEKYDYAFDGMGGNWPCIITPYSGTIRPYGDSVNLDAVVHFCTTKNSCPSGSVGLLPYNTGLCDPNPNLYTSIRLSIKPENLPHTLYSDIKTVTCDSCFAQPTITTPNQITLVDSNEYAMTTTIIGLQPNQHYTYNFSILEANWPIKVSPSSGSIIVGKNRATITNHIMFCRNDSLCPNGDEDIMEYALHPSCLLERNYFGILQLELTNNDCEMGSVYSNPLPVYCNECLPSTTINLFNSNKRTVNSTENDNGFLVEPNIVGLKPNHEYIYQLRSLDANWPVFASPISGTIRSSSSNEVSLSSQLFFCASTGICPSGTDGVLAYSIDPVLSNRIKKDPYINLQLRLTDTSCSEIYDSPTLLIYCDNCIPKPDVRIVSNQIT
jgi:hypothetical protein